MLNKNQKDKLNKLSKKLDKERKEKNKKAVDFAKKQNLKLKYKTKEKNDVELIELDDDGLPIYFITENREGGELIKTNRVYPNGGAGYALTGHGEILGMWDGGGTLTTHQEFTGGRVIQKDSPSGYCDHATHVAGTMIAAGAFPNARGMSHQAILHAYDWNGDNSEMAAEAEDGLRVSQHSYGKITGWFYGEAILGYEGWYWLGNVSINETIDYKWGFYNNNTKNWDEISYNAPDYLIVKSAGNDRGYGPPSGTLHYFIQEGYLYQGTTHRELDGGSDGYKCISHEGLGKNILTVGAVDNNKSMASFSAWGPTNDGRVKPDIVAKGVSVTSSGAGSNNTYLTYNGTSMSGPMISGSVGIILQHQKNLHPNEDLLSSTVKGLILHTADDTISGSLGPNYERGWGLMNTEKIINLMTENINNQNKNIKEETLQNHETHVFDIITKSSSEPLIVTLTWTDPPGTPTSPQLNPPDLMLVNDLDVCVVDENENIYEPYVLDPSVPSLGASNGDNYRDNVEKIVINNPTPDSNYKVIVTHKGNLVDDENNISTQDYSLIIGGVI